MKCWVYKPLKTKIVPHSQSSCCGVKISKKKVSQVPIIIYFMHPHGPSASFTWPSKDDICWVPNTHIICKIDIPLTDTGRTYHLSKDNEKKITDTFNRM